VDRKVRGERFRLHGVTPMQYIAKFPNNYHKTQSAGGKLNTEPHLEILQRLQQYHAK
jgi:hypothetical protein